VFPAPRNLAKTAPTMLVNFASWSRIKNVNCAARSPRSMTRLAANPSPIRAEKQPPSPLLSLADFRGPFGE
jgi:hypothetical protein